MLFVFSRETNLKVRQPLIETAELGDDLKALSDFQGILLFVHPVHVSFLIPLELYFKWETFRTHSGIVNSML